MGSTTTDLTREDAKQDEGTPRTSKRRYWHHKPRNTVVVEACPFSELPAAGRVFVVGMPTAQALDGWCGSADDVTLFLDGHHPVVHAGDRTITDAAQWWGDGIDVDLAQRSWAWVQGRVQRLWRDPDVVLLNTPGTTGRDLWMRTDAADDCQTMSAELQRLVRSTSGQGRIETFPARGELVAGLFEYDMRLAYAAVLRGLPSGEPEVRQRTPLEVVCGHRSRALVRFRPPDGWAPRPGIIGVRHDETAGWSWPTEPRWHGPTWADGCEIELAVRHGWEFEVDQALVWPTTGEPLRLWSERLLKLVRDAETELSPEGFRHVRAMVRAILLHTVGAFHGAQHRVTRTAPSLADAPIGADMLRVHPGGSVSWREYTEPKWPEAVHPEWSAHVWARCRRRLLETPGGGGMLHADPLTLVAVRTDAVYLTQPVGWCDGDDGAAGRWVLKHADHSSQPWPRTSNEVLAARKGAR